MLNQESFKMGYYTIYTLKNRDETIYQVDSGKTIYIPKIRKYILNKNRDVKEFTDLSEAKSYVNLKLNQSKNKKIKKLENIPKSLYLILIKEESTNNTFIKVGITSKRFLFRRFSKIYGYDGYVIESILRRIETPYAEKLEEIIKDKLKKKSIKKYRPLLESFSGYSECFDYLYLNDIINIFDESVEKS